jgi:hypothetical protein
MKKLFKKVWNIIFPTKIEAPLFEPETKRNPVILRVLDVQELSEAHGRRIAVDADYPHGHTEEYSNVWVGDKLKSEYDDTVFIVEDMKYSGKNWLILKCALGSTLLPGTYLRNTW